jgi:hypothetical protein
MLRPLSHLLNSGENFLNLPHAGHLACHLHLVAGFVGQGLKKPGFCVIQNYSYNRMNDYCQAQFQAES